MGESMKKTDLAYLAGFFDGEGCINISKTDNGGYRCLVSVSNTNEWIIQLLRFSFGGNISFQEKSKLNPDWRDVWRWQASAKQANKAINSLLPYLILKKPQAMLAIRFQARKKTGKYSSGRSKIQDEAEYILMKSYNKRG